MCGKPKRPRIPDIEPPAPPKEEKIKTEEEERRRRRKAQGFSSTIITSPTGVSKGPETLTKRTLLGG